MAGSGGDWKSLIVTGHPAVPTMGRCDFCLVTLTGACLVINQRLTGSRSLGDGNREEGAVSWKGTPWQRSCRGKWAMH
jgi:hypothetical protein